MLQINYNSNCSRTSVCYFINMRDLDPDYNCITNNNVLTTKYYLENDFNDITKSNDDYAKGLSLLHLNVRSIPKNIDKLTVSRMF